MAWCERKRIGYIFGLAGNSVLLRRVSPLAEDAALGRIATGGGRKVVLSDMLPRHRHDRPDACHRLVTGNTAEPRSKHFSPSFPRSQRPFPYTASSPIQTWLSGRSRPCTAYCRRKQS